MKSIPKFLKEHYPLAIVLAIAIGTYFVGGTGFSEIRYGVIRVLAVILVSFGVLNLVFKSTVRPYIEDGDFATDFARHPQKTWMTVALIAIIIWAATECFVHASDATDMLQESRWVAAEVRPEKLHFAEALTNQITRNRARYEALSNETGVPWTIIACLHNMECGQSFRENLANGDPLTARTRNVPVGRPKVGRPVFSFEEAAVDALRFDRMDKRDWSGIGVTLQNIESYNGLGYELQHRVTPYLWSWTTIYRRGKYVADGRFDPYAVSEQCGVAPLLKLLPPEARDER